MVTKVNDMDLRVLSLFTQGYNKEYYIREVEKILGISSRTALKTLAKLERQKILEAKTKGKIKLYSIKETIESREYFVLAEQYKKIFFLEKNQLVKEVIEKIEEFTKGIVIIFGSYAKGSAKQESDLDVFIVGKYEEKKIRTIGKTYGIDINIKSYPRKIFEKKRETDIFLKEIQQYHVLIKGIEEFVWGAKQWIK